MGKMFSFNFCGTDSGPDLQSGLSSSFLGADSGSGSGPLCKEITCPRRWQEAEIPHSTALVVTGTVSASGQSSSLFEVKRLDPQSSVFQPQALSSRGFPPESDLVPGSYGGGYKVWECSLDLCRFVLDPGKMQGYKTVQGGRVLELGCGHGLPGLAAYVGHGAASLILTDLNREVIEDVTWPNVLLNCSSAAQRQAVRCISGLG